MSRLSSTVRPPSWGEGLIQYPEPQQYESKTNIYFFLGVLVEFFSIACVAVLAYFLRFTEEFQYYKWDSGIGDLNRNKYSNCRNYSLALYPVPDAVFYSLVPAVPIVVIILGEIGLLFFSEKKRKVLVASSNSLRISLVARRLIRFIAIFGLGLFLTSVIVDMLKLLTGRPRPYYNTLNSSVPKCASSGSPSTIREASLSFPSFHSAEVAFAATYLGCYLHRLLRLHGTYSIRPLLTSALVAWVTVFSLHRWMVNENHWEDIVIGVALGATIAFYLVICILHSFSETSKEFGETIDPTPGPPFQSTNQAVNTGSRWHDYLSGISATKPIMAFEQDQHAHRY